MKILTCTNYEFVQLAKVESYDYIIILTPSGNFLNTGHKCTRSAYENWVTSNYKYFRWHSTKHCKVCHKTWPKEVQVTVSLLGN